MEIREYDLTFGKHFNLVRLGLLDLHQHVGPPKDIPRRIDNLGADPLVGLIGEPASSPGSGLNQYGVSVPDKQFDSNRKEPYSILVGLGLSRRAYDHFALLKSTFTLDSSA
jgi:hypothetical protein